MLDWLLKIGDVLDKAPSPIRLFFRDDDAGWENDKLLNLLDQFAHGEMPIDLAVIPSSLDIALADELLARHQQNDCILGLHQHGFSHTNHETDGRKCEFGISRTKPQQKDDIAKGQGILKTYFGTKIDPLFTPPWNRCTQDTVECLEELGFRLLTRDVTATKLTSSKLQQVPVHIDWSKIIKYSPNPLSELGETISQNFAANKLTGIMLHHAHMGSEQLKPLAELLTILSKHQNVDALLLRDTLN